MAHQGDKFWYYFLRDDKGRPRITVCLMWDHVVAQYNRGITLCSLVDVKSQQFTKKQGRILAKARAVLAGHNAFKTIFPHVTQPLSRLRLTGYDYDGIKAFLGGDLQKVQSNVLLTNYETSLLYETEVARSRRIEKRNRKLTDKFDDDLFEKVLFPNARIYRQPRLIEVPMRTISAAVKISGPPLPQQPDFFYYG